MNQECRKGGNGDSHLLKEKKSQKVGEKVDDNALLSASQIVLI
jgi:hypothetical protein